MKKLVYLIAVSAAVFTYQSCKNSAKDSKGVADSLNKVKDTTSNVNATGGIAVEPSDAEFATKAAAGGLAEVELGRLALTKTTNAKLLKFANMMISDHGKANEELAGIAKKKNITLPAALDKDHEQKKDELSKKSGKDFEKAYTDAMVDGHKKTLKLMQDESKEGKDADLKAFALKTTSIVQTHLDTINMIHDSMK